MKVPFSTNLLLNVDNGVVSEMTQVQLLGGKQFKDCFPVTRDFSTVKKIYFYSDVIVSRPKLKSFLEANDIKVTRNIGEADLVIVSYKSFVGEVKFNFKRTCTLGSLRKTFADFIVNSPDAPKVKSILDLTAAYGDDISVTGVFLASLTSYKTLTNFGSVVIVKDNGFLFSGTIDHSKFFLDTSLNSVIGDTVIDEEAYNSLSTMFESQDKSNHILAMTIMSNCQYRKSVKYLILLCQKYFNQMSLSKYRNSVAFKSLTQWLDFNYHRPYSAWGTVELFIRENIETEETDTFVKKMISDEIRLKVGNNFTVGDIQLNKSSGITDEIIAEYNDIVNLVGYAERLPVGTELL